MAERSLDVAGLDATQGGFAMPDWASVSAWVTQTIPESDQRQAWDRIAETWLARLAPQVGPHHRVVRRGNITAVSALDEKRTDAILAFGHRVLEELRAAAPDVVLVDPVGPFVLVLFDDAARMHDYYSLFDPKEGASATIGGAYLNRGYGHVIGPTEPAWHLQELIAHELTHAMLVARGLPSWLEEGIAQVVAERLLGQPSFQLDHQRVREHRSYWSRRGLGSFWSGEAFIEVRGQELAYHLAFWFVRLLAVDYSKQYGVLVRSARAEDGGADAVRTAFGLELDAFARHLVGL